MLKLKTNSNKLFYYELNDSTHCWALEALPYVDKLLKPSFLKIRIFIVCRMKEIQLLQITIIKIK